MAFDSSLFPPSFTRLIDVLAKLPTIGRKTAQRLAYHLVTSDRRLMSDISDALLAAKDSVKLCSVCYFLSDESECGICRAKNRERDVICVVEKPIDVVSIERSGRYKGVYHVLHGLWAPLRGQGEESMKLRELVGRVEKEKTKEVILALDATVEGDATSLYVAGELRKLGVTVTRLAFGLPRGGELEFADDLTLSHAFEGRKNIAL
ncbi:MAG: recombination protein RecR [Candidatus Dadabacteria bacterium]|nr:MAG: recombination protein RecR [Candidatus Dadabacteria bacterium]